ncbi:porin [Mesorhizobium sp. ZMM04-4]
MGATDSLYNTFVGFAGPVINDDTGFGYGGGRTHQIAYTFNGGNGFSAAIALEGGEGDDYLDSYVPHVVGGLGWVGGWGGVTGVLGYDSNYETIAGKLRADFNVGDSVSLFVMGGWSDDEANFYKGWGGDWAIWGGGSWRFSEKAAFNVQINYDDADNFGAVANVEYELVNNFVITPEVAYSDNFDEDDADEWGGYLRFQMNWGS